MLRPEDEGHDDAFHVSGPDHVSSNGRFLEVACSPRWNEENYKRAAIACSVQAAYVHEMDRQVKRTGQHALAPGWWITFKYNFLRALTDTRDGSIVGVILEWDQSARVSNYLVSRPSGAPKAVLALRGTLVTSSTTTRDMIDNTLIATVGNLEGCPRFEGAMDAIMSLIKSYGSNNVCVAGHSLGAAYALQLVEKLKDLGTNVEVHAFNPPCGLLHGILRPIVFDIIGFVWCKVKRLILKNQPQICQGETEVVPHVYVNRNDYLSAAYKEKPKFNSTNVKLMSVKTKVDDMELTSKLYTLEKENERFIVAHGIAQWWSNDLKLKIDFVYTDSKA